MPLPRTIRANPKRAAAPTCSHAVRTPEKNFGQARLPVGGIRSIPAASAIGLASEAGIDLAALSPSGPGGRIVAQDVETAMAKAGKTPWRRIGRIAQPALALSAAPSADQVKAQFALPEATRKSLPLDGMRQHRYRGGVLAWSPSRPCRTSISPAMSRSSA